MGVRNPQSGSGRWFALALATVALAPLALAVRADAYLYWTNGGGTGTTIARANLDGTGVNTNFITGDISTLGLAVDGKYIYWSGLNTNRIWRAALSGTGPNQTLVSTNYGAAGLAVDGVHIYWAGQYQAGQGLGLQAAIGRATLQGAGVTDVDETFITVPPTSGFPSTVIGVAVDSDYIYWANSTAGAIGRATLDGQNVVQNFIGGQNSPWGVAVDSAAIPAADRQIYWTNSVFPGGSVGGAKLSDPTKVDLSIPGFRPEGVAADATHVFWVSRETNLIGRANLDGTGVDIDFIQDISPSAMAVDALGAACAGREPTVVGTQRRDTLRGTSRSDVISALGGDDTVAGLGGDDLVCGAGGDDVLRGHRGDDKLRGGADDDKLGGGPGADVHRGGPGDDICHGGGGRDAKQGC